MGYAGLGTVNQPHCRSSAIRIDCIVGAPDPAKLGSTFRLYLAGKTLAAKWQEGHGKESTDVCVGYDCQNREACYACSQPPSLRFASTVVLTFCLCLPFRRIGPHAFRGVGGMGLEPQEASIAA